MDLSPLDFKYDDLLLKYKNLSDTLTELNLKVE